VRENLVFDSLIYLDQVEIFKNRSSSGSRQSGWGERIHGERWARACNRGMGAVPPVGSRGNAPGRGFRGLRCPEADEILAIRTVSLLPLLY